MISYPPSKLDSFELIAYEWIDDLRFTRNPKDFIDRPDDYIQIVKARFLKAGWHGDGNIELVWIPPFMFKGAKTEEFTRGVIVWHVKQKEDGISWILSPIKLPCQTEYQ